MITHNYMSLSLKQQLRQIKNQKQGFAPDSVWVEKNKKAMLARIEQDAGQREPAVQPWQMFMPGRVLFAARPVATFVLVTIVSVVGWTASVSASYQSLPGDFLYNVKIASEKTQIAFAGIVQGSEKKAKLLNNAAKTRAYEAKILISQNKDAKLVEETLIDLEDTVEQVRKTVQSVSEREPENASKVVAQLAQSNTIINRTLGDVLDDSERLEQGLVEKVVNTKKVVTGKSIEAVQNVVKKQEEGAIGSDQSEHVKDAVEDVIETVNDNLEDTAAIIQRIKNAEAKRASSTPLTNAISSTTLESITEDGPTTNQDTQENGIDSAKKDIADDLKQLLQLVDEGKLSEALERIANANNSGSKTDEQSVIEEQDHTSSDKEMAIDNAEESGDNKDEADAEQSESVGSSTPQQ